MPTGKNNTEGLPSPKSLHSPAGLRASKHRNAGDAACSECRSKQLPSTQGGGWGAWFTRRNHVLPGEERRLVKDNPDSPLI